MLARLLVAEGRRYEEPQSYVIRVINNSYGQFIMCVFQCCRSIRVGVLGAVVEAEMTTVRCFRRLPLKKYRLRDQETWTMCLAVVAAYWEPAAVQWVVTVIRQDPNLPIPPHLYITPRQVSMSFVRIIAGAEFMAQTAPCPKY
jgi:hypothetical protein